MPDGFGVAYMTGYDGASEQPQTCRLIANLSADRLQFTITSRKEMDNAGFIQEIDLASRELRALFGGGNDVPNSRL